MKSAKRVVFICIGVVMVLLSIGLIAVKKNVDSKEGNKTNEAKNGERRFPGPIDKLVFEAGAAEITVEVGATEEYVLTYEGLHHATLSDSCSDGELKISYRQDDDWPAKMFVDRDISDTQIVLTIPENAVLESALFEFGAAEIEMSNVTAKELSVTVGAGELDAENLTATEKAVFRVGAGVFYAEDVTLSNAMLECGVGEMEISGTITGDSNVECGVGEVQLNLENAEESYCGALDCGLGEIQCGKTQISGSGKNNFGTSSAENRMDIKCGIGEVDVYFNK